MGLVVPAVLPSSKKDFEERLSLFSKIPLVSPDGTVGVSRIQIDVVDGLFATPASWPYTAPEELKSCGMLPRLEKCTYEIDLMCLDAESAAEAWLALGATRLTFHAEADTNPKRLLLSARKHFGHIVSFGLALNIDTDISLVEKYLGDIEYVQFMSIAKIGRQGQLFDSRVLDKISEFHLKHPGVAIQVDGGVSLENAKELLHAGVSCLIIGSKIVRAKDPSAVIAAFENLQTSFGV